MRLKMQTAIQKANQMSSSVKCVARIWRSAGGAVAMPSKYTNSAPAPTVGRYQSFAVRGLMKNGIQELSCTTSANGIPVFGAIERW